MTPHRPIKDKLNELERTNAQMRESLGKPAKAPDTTMTTAVRLEKAQNDHAALNAEVEAKKPKTKELSKVEQITKQLKQCDFTTDAALSVSEQMKKLRSEGDKLEAAVSQLLDICAKKSGGADE
ncbi:hypothetical protein P0Y35_05860 [Kiritimatiellaeota bacterium B1221]|nr:hypothetical protein [Kiritimatiellaeota bacterium B1221]